MKKIATLLIAAIIGITVAQARDIISRNINDLPSSAQTMLKKHFSKQKVNHIKIDKKILGQTEYDVILNDGTEIEFNHQGEWKDIDRGATAVPNALIPKAITDYVNRNYKGNKIVAIEKSSHKYEIELSNGLDLEFDRAGNFIKID